MSLGDYLKMWKINYKLTDKDMLILMFFSMLIGGILVKLIFYK